MVMTHFLTNNVLFLFGCHRCLKRREKVPVPEGGQGGVYAV